MRDEEMHEWDRQPRETSRSYELFCTYRDLGTERSLAKAKESAEGIPSVARLKVLSRKWNWVERCQKYDDYLEHQRRLQQQKQRREMNERHAKVGQFSQNVALRRLEKLVRDVEDDKSAMSAADTARLLDVGVKIERLARGEPTNVQENVGAGGAPIHIDHRPFVLAVRAALGFQDPQWREIESGNSRSLLPPANLRVP